MQHDRVRIRSERIDKPVRFLFLSDLHDRPAPGVLARMERERPDFVAFAGDLVNRHGERAELALDFIERAAAICPVYFSVGNHENYLSDMPWERLRQAGVCVLDNRETVFGGLRIGGLSSWLRAESKREEGMAFARSFCREDGVFRLLLCHHPEYYSLFLKDLPCELILSGHAHGGQVRLLGQGLFAPGQGVFPKYTSGLYHGRLLVGRGMANNAFAPRIFNPTQTVTVELLPADFS